MDAKGHQLKSPANNRAAARCIVAMLVSCLLLMPQFAAANASVDAIVVKFAATRRLRVYRRSPPATASSSSRRCARM